MMGRYAPCLCPAARLRCQPANPPDALPSWIQYIMSRRYAIPCAVLLAALPSCDSPAGSDPEPDPQPARVQVVGGNGQTGAPSGRLVDSLAVKVEYADGQPVPQVAVAWSVASGGGTLSAATSTTDAAGMAKVAWTLGAAGPNAATATAGSLPPAGFTAIAVPVASVTLSSTTVTVGKGDATALAATARDSTGAVLAGRSVVWSTSSAATAAVSESGMVTGKALGTATITATSEGKSASAEVTVTTDERTPPRLVGFSFAPSQVDVTAAPATVELTVHATDGGLGISHFGVGFQGASPVTAVGCSGGMYGNGTLVSGTPEDGVWTCTLTFPRGAAAGVWAVPHVSLIDGAGNQSTYNTAMLAAAGLPTTVTVVNTAPPETPPALTGLSFSPGSVNVGDADATVEITIAGTASAGVHQAYVDMRSTRGSLSRPCFSTTPASGTARAGTWKCSIIIPHRAPGGTWNVGVVKLTDSVGQDTQLTMPQVAALGLPTSFEVLSPNEDLTAPVLTGVTLNPSTLSVSNGAAQGQVTFTATDAGVGVTFGSVTLWPPSGGSAGCGDEPDNRIPQQNATLTCTFDIAASAAGGRWTLAVLVRDEAGNTREYSAQQLQEAGFAFELTVTR
jgi:hypothetical protein